MLTHGNLVLGLAVTLMNGIAVAAQQPAGTPQPSLEHKKLAAFVGTHHPTEFRPIEFADEGATKRATIPGRLKSVVQRIRGRDQTKPVLFENCFNQIHASTQVIALGESEYDDGVVSFRTTGSHGLYSQFEWTVGAPPLSTAM